jgi:teichuronic acid biosynthesis glycosyltransferase TuaH
MPLWRDCLNTPRKDREGRRVNTADPCLVWLANKMWEDHSVDRSMAAELSRYTPVLWVDAPVSVATPARARFGAARTARPVLSVLTDRITRLTPAALPGMTRPGVRASTAPLLRSQVRWALRRTGLPPLAVVATWFEGVLGWRRHGVTTALYATDDYVAGAELMRLPAGWLRLQEQRALASADLVTAQSILLADHWSALYRRPVTFIPNGCAPGRPVTAAVPAAVRALPRPVVGLAGRFNARIDMDLLETIAGAGFSLLLLGPCDHRWEPGRFAALTARPRVHYAGRVPPGEVPAYLAAADVGITPYLDSQFNRASFPVKMLDYLSAGRPVVSTDLPAARWLADDLAHSGQAAGAGRILALASDRPGFVAALRRLAGEPDVAGLCRAFAERHSWSRRAATLARLLGLTQPGDGGPATPGGGPEYERIYRALPVSDQL